MYKDMIAELSKKFTTYAIDFPGFGKSDEPDSSYTVEDYAKLTLEFIEKNNIPKIKIRRPEPMQAPVIDKKSKGLVVDFD